MQRTATTFDSEIHTAQAKLSELIHLTENQPTLNVSIPVPAVSKQCTLLSISFSSSSRLELLRISQLYAWSFSLVRQHVTSHVHKHLVVRTRTCAHKQLEFARFADFVLNRFTGSYANAVQRDLYRENGI